VGNVDVFIPAFNKRKHWIDIACTITFFKLAIHFLFQSNLILEHFYSRTTKKTQFGELFYSTLRFWPH